MAAGILSYCSDYGKRVGPGFVVHTSERLCPLLRRSPQFLTPHGDPSDIVRIRKRSSIPGPKAFSMRKAISGASANFPFSKSERVALRTFRPAFPE